MVSRGDETIWGPKCYIAKAIGDLTLQAGNKRKKNKKKRKRKGYGTIHMR